MQLNHVGIINKSEEDAVRFYGDFLGFEKTREFYVPSELSEQLFSISRDIKMLVFEMDGVKLELFISPDFKPASPDMMHSGFLLNDLTETLNKAPQAGVEVIIGKTKDKTVYFLRDFSGNLIEIKQM